MELLYRVFTVKQITQMYPGIFTEASIRYLIFHEKTNGFSKCIKRMGRKILIDLDSFEAWIQSQNK